MTPGPDPTPTDETLPPAWQGDAGAREPALGTHIGNYRLDRVLGRGAMGVVYRAHAAHLGRDVALKVISPHYAGVQEARSRFEREARAAARTAAHPGIAGVHDLGAINNLPYLVMELVEGPTLGDAIETEQFSDRALVQLLAQAARAVHHAHGCGVLHRDIKPSNLIVAGDGSIRVTDFGLATLSLSGAQMTRLTTAGAAVGTPAFMPPEQARGASCDARSDVYSLGATLFHTLTGRAPVAEGEVTEMVDRVIAGDLLSPYSRRPDLAPELAAILARALCVSPEDRYPTAAAFADDLDRWLAGTAIEAPAAPGDRPPMPAAVKWGAAGALGAVVASWAVWWAVQPDTGPAPTPATVDAVQRARNAADAATESTAAFAFLTQRCAESIAVLEDHFHGARVDAADRAGALDTVAAVAAEFGDAATPWIAFAQWLADGGTGSLEPLAHAAQRVNDPLADLLLIRAHALRYIGALPDPLFTFNEAQIRVRPAAETKAVAAARSALSKAVALWQTRRAGHPVVEGHELRAFTGGVEALAAGDHGRVIGLLEPLADDPLVGRESQLLRGYSLHLTQRFDHAAAVLEPLGASGWTLALDLAARSHLFDAVLRTRDGESADPALERAEVLLTAWIARAPGPALPYVLRGEAHELRATLLSKSGGDALVAMQAALADYDLALDDSRSRRVPGTRMNRVRVGIKLGRWQRQRLRDYTAAAAYLQQAIQDAEAARESGRPAVEWRMAMGDANLELAIGRWESRSDPRAHAERARDLYAEEAAAVPSARALTNAGKAQSYLVRYEVRQGRSAMDGIQRAADWFDQAVKLDPRYASGWEYLAIAMNQVGLERRRRKQPREAIVAYERAIEAHSEMIKRFPTRRAHQLWNRAGCHANIGLAKDLLKEDYRDGCTLAIADADASIRLNPKDSWAWKTRGTAYQVRAGHELRFGEEAKALPDLTKALADYEQAVRLSPALAKSLAKAVDYCRRRLERR